MKVDTKTQILDIAEQLTKSKGFDSFSYRDISEIVGIKTSSIHYYFPAKVDLANALVAQYTDKFAVALKGINAQSLSGFGKLSALFSALNSLSGENRDFCVCGMLSANVYTMSEAVEDKLDCFFTLFEGWIVDVLKEGIDDGSICSTIHPQNTAAEIVATGEGAMLIARVRKQPQYFADMMNILLNRLKV